MLGSFAVGKSSLVRRFVENLFSDEYTTTIGVKIDKKSITVEETDLSLLLWDVYGEDNHQTVLPAYLRGMAGYILVVDPTRPGTYESAISLNKLVTKTLGEKPFVFVLNKSDIKDKWAYESSDLKDEVQLLSNSAVAVVETSAKTETGVNEMFETLAIALLPEGRS